MSEAVNFLRVFGFLILLPMGVSTFIGIMIMRQTRDPRWWQSAKSEGFDDFMMLSLLTQSIILRAPCCLSRDSFSFSL